MFVLLCILTGATIAGAAAQAYLRWRDPLHPTVVMALPFGFMLAVWPLILNARGGLETFFGSYELVWIQGIYLLSIVCFSIGMLSTSPRRATMAQPKFLTVLSSGERRRLYQAALILGTSSVSAYVYMIYNEGGFVQAYSYVKGGGSASSGYISEMILFSPAAVLALAISRAAAGSRVRTTDIYLAFLFMSPDLIQGTLGGRRGPIFLALATLFFGWTIVHLRRLSVRKVFVGVGIAGLSLFLVWSQRQNVYLGSGDRIELSRLQQVIEPEAVTAGDTYVNGGLHMISADYYRSYYWGYRYFVTFFVRPVPRQLWPTKYEDMGATWVYGLDEEDKALIRNATGFDTPGGAAMPSVADVYLEFSWGVLPFFLTLGWVFAKAWTLHRTKGGEWTIIFLVMLALSVFLASQNFEAWAHRVLFVSVPIILLWKYWIHRVARGRTSLVQRALLATDLEAASDSH